MRALLNPTSARQRCAQPATGRRTCVAVCASTVPAPAPGKSGSEQVDETLHFKLVMEALKKEHERHGQGKCMFVSMEGSGRRQTVGWDIQHVGNLSGDAVRSVDYSMYG